jgi:hypothetical protein
MPLVHARPDSSPGGRPRVWIPSAIALLVIFFAFFAGRKFPFSQKDAGTMDGINRVHESLAKFLETPEIPETADLALLNLLCDPSLERDEIGNYLLMVDAMAEAVRKETEKGRARYLSKPTEFSSEVEWRLCMLSTVLGKDFKIKYDPKLSTPEMLESPINVFFAEPRKVFITGCLGPERVGTCSSLPVMYVAVGRRLGYPLHLVATKGHLFARWDDGAGTIMNIEAANSGGFTTNSDDHYRNWPRRISKEEETARGYLKNLSAKEAFANFLTIRSAALQAAGNLPESAFAAASAYRLAPNLGGTRESLILSLPAASRPTMPIELQAFLQERSSIGPTHSGIPFPGPNPGILPAYNTSMLPNPPAPPGLPNPYAHHPPTLPP